MDMLARACKSHVYSLGTLSSALSGDCTDIHRQMHNIRTWHTTSIQASYADYTRAKIRTHPPSCRDPEASAYIPEDDDFG